jgi:hypothetical protein
MTVPAKRRWRDWFMDNIVWRGQWQLQRPPEHPAERAERGAEPPPRDITRLDLDSDSSHESDRR